MIRRNAGRASSLWRRHQFGKVLQTQVWWRLYSTERYNRPWSVAVGETVKLSYAAECGKKSVITFTWMPPLYKTPWVCHSQASDPPVSGGGGLQGSGTNEAAGISLARNNPLCGEPFSWLEAAPSTSNYFPVWKGYTINDAIMLMVCQAARLPPVLLSINPVEERHGESVMVQIRSINVSMNLRFPEKWYRQWKVDDNDWLGNNTTLVYCPWTFLAYSQYQIGGQAERVFWRSNQDFGRMINLILTVWYNLCFCNHGAWYELFGLQGAFSFCQTSSKSFHPLVICCLIEAMFSSLMGWNTYTVGLCNSQQTMWSQLVICQPYSWRDSCEDICQHEKRTCSP